MTKLCFVSVATAVSGTLLLERSRHKETRGWSGPRHLQLERVALYVMCTYATCIPLLLLRL